MSDPERDAWDRWLAFRETVPLEVRACFPDVPWRIELLHALWLPVTSVALTEVDWLLDVRLWRDDRGRRFRVRPRDVLERPELHPGELARVRAADLRAPIHVTRHGARLTVLDGNHRVLKAVGLGLDALPAMHLGTAELDAVAVRPPAQS